MSTRVRIGIGLILLLVLLQTSGGGIVSPRVDTAVVVYESADGALPPYVWGALQDLEAAGLQVRAIDDDVVTGTGDQPEHVQAAIEAARERGLPSLVTLGGGQVRECVALPGTREEIVEAVR